MAAAQTAFEPGASLARIRAYQGGWLVDCRGPNAMQQRLYIHDSHVADEVRELEDGGWSVRFHPSAERIKRLAEQYANEDQ